MIFLYVLSFVPWIWVSGSPGERVAPFIAAGLAQNLLWLLLFARRERLSVRPLVLSFLFILILARSLPPLYENDHFRYFWDGYQTLTTGNPYVLAPVFANGPEAIRASIGFPEIPTIYPPVAQGLFALFVWLGGGSLAWFLGLFAFTGLAVFLLGFYRLLRREGVADATVICCLVAQHPLLVKEWVQSCHLDVWIAASIVWAFTARGALGASVSLALGAGVKLVSGIAAMGMRVRWTALVAVTILPWLIFLDGFLDFWGTLLTFGRSWEMNSGVFRWIREAGMSGVAARGTCAVLWVIGLFVARRISGISPIERVYWALFSLVALSPVANTWYFTWCLPLAVFLPEPRRTNTFLAVAPLPLSYAFYFPEGQGWLALERWWDIEHVGIWLAVAGAIATRYRSASRFAVAPNVAGATPR